MTDNPSTYVIRSRNQWWIDSGIAGLYNIAIQHQIASKHNISVTIENKTMVLHYSDREQLGEFLSDCYEKLAEMYWNVSTKRQIEDPKAVFYDADNDEFMLKPKRNPTPIPNLFTKGSSWRLPDDKSGIPWDEIDDSLKPRLEKFLTETRAELWGSKKVLLLKDPVCHKELDILPVEGRRKNVCSICGQQSSKCSDVSQPTYLLFASNTATKSFNSEGGKADKVCWECEFLSRFAVDSASYKKIFPTIKRKNASAENIRKFYDLFIVQVVSPDLKKTINMVEKVGASSSIRQLDTENYYCNIRTDKNSLITYSRLPFEFLWAFYSDWYGLLRQEWETKQSSQDHSLLDELLGISLEDAPLQLVLLVVGNKGQTFIIKNIIFYNDTAYVFRLMNLMDDTNISFSGLYNSLYNRVDKDKENDFRNEFFYRVLNKKSVVLQTERFAYHVSMLSKEDQPVFLKEIVDFVRFYETEMGVAQMNREQVEVAVNLGKSIVLQARQNLNPDEFKKVKGDLFTLRKSRTTGTFLSQIKTLQLRYGLTVSGRIAEGILENVPFEEFKAYCMLGALNTFNSFTKAKKDEGGQQA